MVYSFPNSQLQRGALPVVIAAIIIFAASKGKKSFALALVLSALWTAAYPDLAERMSFESVVRSLHDSQINGFVSSVKGYGLPEPRKPP